MLTLTQDDVRLDAHASNKVDAIRQVAKALAEAGLTTGDYVEGMLQREAQSATYLGSGIAIPHGTTQTRSQVHNTGVKILHFADGVEWADGQKAYVVIGIAAKSDEHLTILRQLTRVLSDESIAAELRKVSTEARLVALLNGEQQTPPLLLDETTLLDSFPAKDLLSLQAAAAGLLANHQAIGQAGVLAAVTDQPTALGQGLWLGRIDQEVQQSAVALVRSASPFVHQGAEVKALLLLAARDNRIMPVLQALTALIANQQQQKICDLPLPELIALLSAEPLGSGAACEATFTIINPHGLHARPGAMLVKTCKEFTSQIWVANLDGDGKAVNGKSLMKLVSLGVKQGHRLHFSAEGADAAEALKTIGEAIATGLGEGAAE